MILRHFTYMPPSVIRARLALLRLIVRLRRASLPPIPTMHRISSAHRSFRARPRSLMASKSWSLEAATARGAGTGGCGRLEGSFTRNTVSATSIAAESASLACGTNQPNQSGRGSAATRCRTRASNPNDGSIAGTSPSKLRNAAKLLNARPASRATRQMLFHARDAQTDSPAGPDTRSVPLKRLRTS